MALYRLVYTSKATNPFSLDELRQLVDTAADRNQMRDITGILVYSAGYFIQVLEGEKDQLNSLLTKIADDPRHTDVECLLTEPITTRSFTYWGMRLLHLDHDADLDINRLRALRRQALTVSSPASSSHTMAFLREFCAQLPATLPQTAGTDLISNLPD